MQNKCNKKSSVIPENYSAGLMSQSFWFLEFKKALKLRKGGLAYEEIKKKCVGENLFGVGKEYRAERICGYITARLRTMDEELAEIFEDADLQAQKLINLVAIIKTDRLFFEFLYETYCEKLRLGAEYLEEADAKAFFTRKEAQSESVAGWNENTKKRLRSAYFNYMTEANLLAPREKHEKQRKITPPLLDAELERCIANRGEEAIIRALTGGN